MVRWIRARLSGEAGISLPELLVSITIMSVVSAAIISSVVAVNQTLGVANATVYDTATTRIGVQRVSQLLRGAVGTDGDLSRSDAALVTAATTDVTFYTLTGTPNGGNPVQYRLWVNGNADLVERRVDPVPVLASAGVGIYTGAAEERVIIRDVQTLDALGQPIPIFRYWSHYWDRDDNFDNIVDQPISDRCGREILPAGATLAAGDLMDVDSVSTTLVVRAPSAYANTAVELRSWARFASAEDLGFSASFDSAGCLDAANGGFGYDS